MVRQVWKEKLGRDRHRREMGGETGAGETWVGRKM